MQSSLTRSPEERAPHHGSRLHASPHRLQAGQRRHSVQRLEPPVVTFPVLQFEPHRSHFESLLGSRAAFDKSKVVTAFSNAATVLANSRRCTLPLVITWRNSASPDAGRPVYGPLSRGRSLFNSGISYSKRWALLRPLSSVSSRLAGAKAMSSEIVLTSLVRPEDLVAPWSEWELLLLDCFPSDGAKCNRHAGQNTESSGCTHDGGIQ